MDKRSVGYPRTDSAAGLGHLARVGAPVASALSAAINRRSTKELEDRCARAVYVPFTNLGFGTKFLYRQLGCSAKGAYLLCSLLPFPINQVSAIKNMDTTKYVAKNAALCKPMATQ